MASIATQVLAEQSPAKCPACGARAKRILSGREARGRIWNLARCVSCGQHFTDPMPTDSDILSFYSGNYHSTLRVPGQDKMFGPKYLRYIRRIKQFVPVGARTLDVGCSTGLFPKMLRDAGYNSSGIELHRQSAEWGTRHYGVDIKSVTLEQLRPANKFDLISFTDVLEHTTDPLQTLTIARSLLNDRGHILVTFPDITSWESLYYQALSVIFRRDWLWTTCHVPEHTWEFSPRTARALFNRAGFGVAHYGRAQESHQLNGKLRFLSLPPRALACLSGLLGTQMEFIISRTQERSTT